MPIFAHYDTNTLPYNTDFLLYFPSNDKSLMFDFLLEYHLQGTP